VEKVLLHILAMMFLAIHPVAASEGQRLQDHSFAFLCELVPSPPLQMRVEATLGDGEM
jgi:hypothetical protein